MTVHGSRRPRRAPAATIAILTSACPPACPNCAAPYLEHVGFGTERVEAEVRGPLSGGAARPRRPRHGAAPRQPGGAAGALRAARARRARRHADDCQGPRLPARHAGRRRSRPTSGSGCRISAPPSGRSSCITQVVGRAGRGERRARRSSRRCFPTTTPCAAAARRTTTRSSPRRLDLPRRRCAIRRSPAMVNVVVRGPYGRRGDARRRRPWPRTARGTPALAGCRCSVRRRRRWPGCAASIARSSSSRAAIAGAMRDAVRAALAAHPALARRAVGRRRSGEHALSGLGNSWLSREQRYDRS